MKIEMSKAEEEEARLTGYALGELDAGEAEAVEALLESSPEARVALEEIRATAALLTAEFSKEPPLSLRVEQVEAITGEGKIVRGSFFSEHRNFLSVGAVAACACLFAAIGLKPYLAGLEERDSAPQEEIAATAGIEYLEEAGRAAASEAPFELEREVAAAPAEAAGLKKGSGGDRAEAGLVSESLAPLSDDKFRRKYNSFGAADSPGSSSQARSKKLEVIEPQAAATPAPGQAPGVDPVLPAPQAGRSRVAASAESKASDASPADMDGAGLGAEELSRGAVRSTLAKEQALGELASAQARKPMNDNFGLRMEDGIASEEAIASSVQEAPLREEGERELLKPRGLWRSAAEAAAGESYGQLIDNPWVSTWDDGLSTFAIDVDTGTYPNLRRFLKRRASLPPKDAVRIEEMVNYFDYDYPEPQSEVPFSVSMEVASCPWAKDHRLLRVGLRGKGLEVDKRPPSNLVFLIDVSGSMRGDDKLELLKRSMRAMVGQLNEDDRIGIVTYAGNSGVVLEPTHGDQKEKIIGVLEQLGAGGSTNGAAGISTAYSLAKANFVEGGTNRVILATDGDFNVGVTASDDLIKMVEERAREKIFLTVLGVGEGNLQEHRMEQIADKGNGSYHYLDSEMEGGKVLVRGLGATLVTVAKDVKVQVDFNPARVAKYRLIGYANRMMPDEAFNEPTADAGEIGAGHTVTALYEMVPAAPGAASGGAANAVSRYREQGGLVESRETLTLKLKYKLPEGDDPEPLIEVPLIDPGTDWAETSEDFRFAAAVAGFGLLLRDSDFAGLLNYDLVLELGGEGVPQEGDEFGLRAEFIDLVNTAKTLSQ